MTYRPFAIACLLLASVGHPVRAAPAPAPATSPQAVLEFLTDAVSWYRQQLAQAQLAAEPGDVVFATAARQQARQALALAFEFARQDVALTGEPGKPAAQAAGGAPNGFSPAQRAAEAEAAAAQAQAALEARQRELARAPPGASGVARDRVAEAQSELQLAKARRDALKALADFAARTGDANGGGSDVLAQIDELQRSVPEIAAGVAPGATPAPAAQDPGAVSRRAAPTGIIALASDVLAFSRKIHQIRSGRELTAALRDSAEKLRAPLVADLRSTIRGVEQAPGADPQDAGAIQQRTRDVDAATARFRRITGALVPLGKLTVLLDAQSASLAEWASAADDQYDADLRRLLLHLGLLTVAIAAIMAASTAWRSATLRYVQEPRRRRQSLLLRRIIVAIALALVLLFSFVTELGSVATFAGFITAGLAVALQNVILSVAAYFFLIGKYGISVGDRVQISGVTGDVIDIGLVRLHLMELRDDGLPTGRVVVFSNAVLFQPNANFFKQMPGSSFAWHQVTLTISADTDYRYAERRLLGAVDAVFERYRSVIEREHDEIAHQLSPIPVHPSTPQSQLLLKQGGLEMTIRFPVPLERAAAVDDEISRALLDAIDREPRLKLVGSATPTIQATPAPAHA